MMPEGVGLERLRRLRSVSFVDVFNVGDPDEEPEPQETVSPPWWGPPEGELGIALPQSLLLGRSDRGVVGLSHTVVYSIGVAFEFIALARGLSRSEAQRLFHEQHGFNDDLPDGFLRLGVELADGRRISNIGARRGRMMGSQGEPEGPVFVPHAGGGGSGHHNRVSLKPGYWLWPMPPPGALRLSCEWPVVDIPLTSVEIDGRAFSEAAENVLRLWE
jgi:hypothetical protein